MGTGKALSGFWLIFHKNDTQNLQLVVVWVTRVTQGIGNVAV